MTLKVAMQRWRAASVLLVLLIGAPVYAQFPITSRCEVVEITGSGDDRKAEFVCAKAKGLVSTQFLQSDGSVILVMPLRDPPWSDMERESGPLRAGSRVVIQRKSKDDWLIWRLERCGTEGPNGLKVECGNKTTPSGDAEQGMVPTVRKFARCL